MANQVLERTAAFAEAHGKELAVGGRTWRYYRVGTGPALIWLTGGLRRAALGHGFMECLAGRFTVVAPDYPPLDTAEQFITALDAILAAEGIRHFALGGQSYGGLLAQVYLAVRPAPVERLILSSSGPADFGRIWLPADYALLFLARVLPERRVKAMLAGGLAKVISAAEPEREAWLEAVRATITDDLTRADVMSHFRVAIDVIRRRIVRPGVYRDWRGRVIALSAENDPTQSKGDQIRFERLFGRPIEMVSMGTMGHTAALLDPVRYAGMLTQALT